MELWIRSQDKECLMKVNRVDYDLSNSEHRIMVNGFETLVGHYETKGRALEVLDEIAAMIKNRYIVKPSGILSQEDMANEHKRLNYLYNGEFIIENPPFEIEPINSNIIYYEMPKE